jgi:hypothetical protein
MGKKDTITKKYTGNNEIFADVFNFYLYGGKSRIHPGQLHELDTSVLALPYGTDGAKMPVQKERDLLRYLAAKTDTYAAYLLLGLENQSEIHYAMPVKNMTYDALNYAKQVEETAKLHRKKKDFKGHSRGEYLSGFYKEDKLIPVITLVLCFTPEEWDAPKSLHAMMNIEDRRILSFVNDYKINLLSPAALKDEEFEYFHTSLKQVLSYIKYSKQEARLEELVKGDPEFSHLDREAAEVIGVCTGTDIQIAEGKETIDMCQAIVDMKKHSFERGMERGKANGIIMFALDLAYANEEIMTALQKNLNITAEQAQEYLDDFYEEKEGETTSYF